MTTSQKQETATRFCCAAAVFALAFPGPVLPLTAVMVCVLGTFIFLYRYRCMQGQPARLWYLAVCLLWLWSNTGINLSGYFTCAPLSLSLLAAASLLCMGGAGLSGRQRLQRLGAFFTPVVFLALIPYALRASETGTLLTNLAIVLLSAEWVFSLIGAVFPQTRRHSRFFIIPLILIVAGSGVAACILGGHIAPGIRLILGIFWPTVLPVLVWGRQLSDYFQRSCGITHPVMLCLLSALTALVPLGIMCYAYNLHVYFY